MSIFYLSRWEEVPKFKTSKIKNMYLQEFGERQEKGMKGSARAGCRTVPASYGNRWLRTVTFKVLAFVLSNGFTWAYY